MWPFDHVPNAAFASNWLTAPTSILSYVIIMQTTKRHGVCPWNLGGSVRKIDPGLKSPEYAIIICGTQVQCMVA